MAATAAQIAQVRRMVNEPTTATYADADITTYIEHYPLMDALGETPYTWDTSTTPASQVANDAWVDTYDLAAAAADIWSEKAAGLAPNFDFSADGASYSRSQAYEQAMKQARYYRSRRSPKTATLQAWPKDDEGITWIGNLPEPD